MNAGRRRFAAALLACAAGLLVVPADRASATEVKLLTCSSDSYGEGSSGEGWYQYRGGPFGRSPQWEIGRDCPSVGVGLRTPLSPATVTGAWASASFTPGMKAGPVALTVEGGTAAEVAYELRSCGLDGCRTERVLAERETGDPAERVSLDFGGGARRLELVATCASDGCGGPEVLRVRNVEFGIADADPPVVVAGVNGIFSTVPSINSYWRRPELTDYSVRFFDYGIGMGRAYLSIDDSPSWFATYAGCNLAAEPLVILSISRRCEAEPQLHGRLDEQHLTDGVHSLTVRAADALGNEAAAAVGYFNIDGTPPPTPEDPIVEGLDADGWTSGAAVKPRWANTGETIRTATQSGLTTGTFDFDPQADGQADPPETVSGLGGANLGTGPWLSIPGEGSWKLYIAVRDSAGNVSGRLKIPVGMDTDSPAAPQLEPLPWLSRDALIEGRAHSWLQPESEELEAGVCGYARAIDSSPGGQPTATITHRGAVASAQVPHTVPAGLSYIHLRAVSCAEVASESSTQILRVDDVKPVVELSGVPVGDRWLREPVAAEIVASDDLSGVSLIEHRIDGGDWSNVVANHSQFLLGEGRHTLTYAARDVAGNRSTDQSREIAIDLTAPDGGFAPLDQAAPQRVRAALVDPLSGVESAQIQIRPAGASKAPWTGLPTAVEAVLPDAERVELSTELQDLEMSDGGYELRIVASDKTGNTAVIDREAPSGIAATRMLPLRERLSLSSGLAKITRKCSRSRSRAGRCRASKHRVIGTKPRLRVQYGERARLAGRVTGPGGEARAGTTLRLRSTIPGESTETVDETATAPDGTYAFEIARGPNRRLEVSAAGDTTTLPVRAEAELEVAAVAVLTVPRGVRAGRTFRLKGRLLSGGEWLPGRGKLIQPQFWNGRRYQSAFDTVRAYPGRGGRFSIPYTFKSAPMKLRVRVAILSEGWPFEDGYSNSVKATVRR